MRNSKAKSLRRALRNQGIAVGQARYENVPGSEKLHPIMGVDGKVTGTYTTVTKRLNVGCGRKIYQNLKRAV